MAFPENFPKDPLLAGHFYDIFHFPFQHQTCFRAFQEFRTLDHHESKRFGPVLHIVAHGIPGYKILIEPACGQIVLPPFPPELAGPHGTETTAGIDKFFVIQAQPFAVQIDLAVIESMENLMIDRKGIEAGIQINGIIAGDSAGWNIFQGQVI